MSDAGEVTITRARYEAYQKAEAELARLRDPDPPKGRRAEVVFDEYSLAGNVRAVINHLEDGICGDPCHVKNVESGCDCAIVRDLLTRQAAEIEEDAGVIRVWRRRTEQAEARLREAVEVIRIGRMIVPFGFEKGNVTAAEYARRADAFLSTLEPTNE